MHIYGYPFGNKVDLIFSLNESGKRMKEEKTINFVDNIVLSNIFLVKTNNEENPIISNASNIVASVIKK